MDDRACACGWTSGAVGGRAGAHPLAAGSCCTAAAALSVDAGVRDVAGAGGPASGVAGLGGRGRERCWTSLFVFEYACCFICWASGCLYMYDVHPRDAGDRGHAGMTPGTVLVPTVIVVLKCCLPDELSRQ